MQRTFSENVKMNYIFKKYHDQILKGTAPRLYSDMFDYYLRYLNLYPEDFGDTPDQIDAANLVISPGLKRSFEKYVESRNKLVEYFKKNNPDDLYEIAPYYSKLTPYNLFDDRGHYFYIDGVRGLKNIFINMPALKNFAITGQPWPTDEIKIYTRTSPDFKQWNDGTAYVRDIWEH